MNNNQWHEMKTTQESCPHHNISQWEDEIKRLVDDCRIYEARQMLSYINKMGIESPILKEWQIVLAPPQISIKNEATGVYFNENFKWLQKHAKEFQEMWVALKNGLLIDSHESLIKLRHSLKHAGKLTDDIVFMEVK